MGWVITGCLIPEAGRNTEVGTGYYAKEASLKDCTMFRLLDDDGNVYFLGSISKKDIYDGSEDVAFAPLDWAMSNYGCTEMQYMNESGDWETL